MCSCYQLELAPFSYSRLCLPSHPRKRDVDIAISHSDPGNAAIWFHGLTARFELHLWRAQEKQALERPNAWRCLSTRFSTLTDNRTTVEVLTQIR